jgi:hypothetical protein
MIARGERIKMPNLSGDTGCCAGCLDFTGLFAELTASTQESKRGKNNLTAQFSHTTHTPEGDF